MHAIGSATPIPVSTRLSNERMPTRGDRRRRCEDARTRRAGSAHSQSCRETDEALAVDFARSAGLAKAFGVGVRCVLRTAFGGSASMLLRNRARVTRIRICTVRPELIEKPGLRQNRGAGSAIAEIIAPNRLRRRWKFFRYGFRTESSGFEKSNSTGGHLC